MATSVLDPTGFWGLFATMLRPWTAQDWYAAFNADIYKGRPLEHFGGC